MRVQIELMVSVVGIMTFWKWLLYLTNWIDGIGCWNNDFLIEILILNLKKWRDDDILSEKNWKRIIIIGSSCLKLDKLNWRYRLLEWWLFNQNISLNLRKWWNDSILSEKYWKRLLYLTQVVLNLTKWVDGIGCRNNDFLIEQLFNNAVHSRYATMLYNYS